MAEITTDQLHKICKFAAPHHPKNGAMQYHCSRRDIGDFDSKEWLDLFHKRRLSRACVCSTQNCEPLKEK